MRRRPTGAFFADRLWRCTSVISWRPKSGFSREYLAIHNLVSYRIVWRFKRVVVKLRRSRAWRIAVCQSLCNIFILFLLRYLLVYVRQLRCILSGSPFTSASHWLVLGTSLLVKRHALSRVSTAVMTFHVYLCLLFRAHRCLLCGRGALRGPPLWMRIQRSLCGPKGRWAACSSSFSSALHTLQLVLSTAFACDTAILIVSVV